MQIVEQRSAPAPLAARYAMVAAGLLLALVGLVVPADFATFGMLANPITGVLWLLLAACAAVAARRRQRLWRWLGLLWAFLLCAFVLSDSWLTVARLTPAGHLRPVDEFHAWPALLVWAGCLLAVVGVAVAVSAGRGAAPPAPGRPDGG